MPKKEPQTVDIRGKMILLGTGTSVGVPAIGCGCDVCNSDHPRNKRTRCAAILGLPEGNLLIDTPPDLRFQLLREGIGVAHAVAYTHEHADHIFGLDDLRLFQFYTDGPVPLYCDEQVESRLRRSFDYAFPSEDFEETHAGSVPALEIRRLVAGQPVRILGADVLPIRLQHGPRFEVLGFRIGDVAYCTDVKTIPAESMTELQGLKTLVLDALRPTPHATHMNIDEALAVVAQLKPKMTYFTHCSCHIDYPTINPQLPPGVQLSYDGLQIDL